MLSKHEVEKFNGTGDYTMWKEKLLVHLDLLDLLGVVYPELEEIEKGKATETDDSKAEDKKAEVDKPSKSKQQSKARSIIVLSLADNVLRKVTKEKTASGMLKLLDDLYSPNTLSSRIHLTQKLFGFAMQQNMSIERNVDDFLRVIANLENVDVAISDEDQAVMLLMSLPPQFSGLRDTLRYSKT
ncbi:uncharacterized protein LOC112089211 [Eutrema salsugineum]|uniref:uncharacterized protein LOC112089211 n=1 Tax=Eutrema salsugineum TaxID=72664 RepID=UPI000CED5D96|nr:uncharacterized protein LOC112089211 [Eutrema salsugineum]